jgi:hypothetical protein
MADNVKRALDCLHRTLRSAFSSIPYIWFSRPYPKNRGSKLRGCDLVGLRVSDGPYLVFKWLC